MDPGGNPPAEAYSQRVSIIRGSIRLRSGAVTHFSIEITWGVGDGNAAILMRLYRQA
jgi:hypothetical protein